jgi:hypothetical protein
MRYSALLRSSYHEVKVIRLLGSGDEASTGKSSIQKIVSGGRRTTGQLGEPNQER